ncbi:hypothetical protein K443DRAFT_550095 [Laccaria amethystina LaAM-08-1]|uniref:Uncharacterized protein n=1 Tax=Laccaria amethystina LaAM-08-1 TaxID=1095629 RepID=A0A0C9XVQ5_9AGAR|nr:hypothetical protein K443DRAFT_550095 [Laccaria amethystina LaAM-08-1]
MASSMSSATVLSTASALPTSTQVISDQTPFDRFLPQLESAFAFLIQALKFGSRFSRLISITLYVIAPVTTFLELVVTLFITTPYHAAAYLLEALYPIYVFLGVAVITGGLLGIMGRVVSIIIVYVVAERKKANSDLEEEEEKSEDEDGIQRRVKFES